MMTNCRCLSCIILLPSRGRARLCAYGVLIWSIKLTAATFASHPSRACCALTDITLLEQDQYQFVDSDHGFPRCIWAGIKRQNPHLTSRGSLHTEPHHGHHVVGICGVFQRGQYNIRGVSWRGPGRDVPFPAIALCSQHCLTVPYTGLWLHF